MTELHSKEARSLNKTEWKKIEEPKAKKRKIPKKKEMKDKKAWGRCEGLSHKRINKSRYGSIDCFISLQDTFKESYNDIDVCIHLDTYKRLIEAGIDHRLARHVAHLFIRDPLVIYGEHIEIDDKKHTDHWENFQSTNWNTVRFKPPPIDDPAMGWRVEFRPMELGLTDFENAAHTIFIALLSRAILSFDLNLYIPMSKVDENMRKAHQRDAILQEKFYFRKIIKTCPGDKQVPVEDEFVLLTLKEIMCGKPPFHPGFIPLIKTYLDVIKCDPETLKMVYAYLELMEQRASGKKMTIAAWLRRYATVHPDYKQNAVVTPLMAYDMIETLDAISKGHVTPSQLFDKPEPIRDPDAGEEEETPELLSNVSLMLPASRGCKQFRKFLLQHLHGSGFQDSSKGDGKPVLLFNPCS